MYVKDKIMYHFNNSDKRRDIWTIGNEIDNTKDYISDYWADGLKFSGRVDTTLGHKQAFFKIIESYLEKEQDNETYIEMLKEACRMLKCYSMLQRELILEEVRKNLYPDLPSRKNTIYLCEKEQLEHWKEKLTRPDKNIELFKVNITGDLFKSSDILLPNSGESIITMYDQAKRYWEADLSTTGDDEIEYLFTGKLKVLEKIDG